MSRSPEPGAGMLDLRPLPTPVRDAVRAGAAVDTAGSHELLRRHGLRPGRHDAAAAVVASWSRSMHAGVDAEDCGDLQDCVVDAGDLRSARERLDELHHGAASMLESFVATCSSRDFTALLADATGVVTMAVGGGNFAGRARRARLIEGASWHESLRGTNAIGTALTIGQPVAVHGAAHFTRANAGLVCFAAPVRDPHGEIVAVLDATSSLERGADFDPSVVITVARAIEEVLRARAYARAEGGGSIDLIERLLDRAGSPAFLIERPGRIVRANAAGRALAHRAARSDFLPSWQMLLEQARSQGHGDAIGEYPIGEHRLDIEPVLDRNGEPLALLVFVQPSRSSLRSAAATTDVLPRPPVPSGSPQAGQRAFAKVIGDDPALLDARDRCLRLANTELPVLLLAETGCGKELFARAVHDASRRADGPFEPVNCGAIQPDLLLSELFGHGAGAFTGASRSGRDGRLAAANGGTLFLDEIGDLSLEAQVALLRVLEDGGYTRIGETARRHVDLRIVAATSRDLDQLVAEGSFRQDLYFRIGGAPIHLPPLRARRDFDLLLRALWSACAAEVDTDLPALDHATREALAAHDWPGNVRELRSTLRYAAAMARGGQQVSPEHLPPAVFTQRGATSSARPEPLLDLDDARRHALVQALRDHPGNISAAARTLGVARSTVYRLARRYGIDTSAS